jgi:LemA protein
MRRWTIMLAAPALIGGLSGCGINSVPRAEEAVNARFADLQGEYQRRADLIPALVATVKGYARQESTVLTQVTEARARATQTRIDAADLSDPAKVAAFNQAQNQVGGALSRLLVSVEAYPDLKSNQNFLTLQSQIEGTENSILVARRDYNAAVQSYNTTIRTFPDAIGARVIHGAKPKVAFENAPGAQNAPKVDFDTPAPGGAASGS